MKVIAFAVMLQFAALLPLAAAPAKTYQVTGPVLEVTDKTVVVQKGDERWELALDSATKTNGNFKVGDKVTVQYRMNATRIDAKTEAEKTKSKE